MVLNNEVLDRLGMGIGSILFGAIVATLGFFTYRCSRVAPILAIVLYVCDSLYTFITVSAEAGSPPIGGIFVRIVIISTPWRAAQAEGELARQGESSEPGQSLHQ